VKLKARLCDRVRERLVKIARKEELKIKQNRYAHSGQMKQAQACQRKLKTNL